MNPRHRQTYLDLNPERQDDPSPLAIWAGAALALVAVWCVAVVFFFL